MSSGRVQAIVNEGFLILAKVQMKFSSLTAFGCSAEF